MLKILAIVFFIVVIGIDFSKAAPLGNDSKVNTNISILLKTH